MARTIWQQPLALAGRSTTAVDPSGRRAAAAVAAPPAAGQLVVFDLRTGAVLGSESTQWHAYSLAFSPDGHWLAAGQQNVSNNTTVVRVLDAETLAERCRYTGADLTIGGLRFSADGKRVIGKANGNYSVYGFDAATGGQLWLRRQDVVPWMTVSPDTATVAVAGNNMIIELDTVDGTERRRVPAPLPGSVASIAYSPDQRTIVAGGGKNGAVWAFDAASGQKTWSAQIPGDGDGTVTSVSVSPDGRLVAAVRLVGFFAAGTLAVYQLVDGTPRLAPVKLDHWGDVAFASPDKLVYGWHFDEIVLPEPRPLAVLGVRDGVAQNVSASGAHHFTVLPGGRYAALSGTQSVELCDLIAESVRVDVGAPLGAIEASQVGTAVVVVADGSAAVTVIDAASGTRLARKPVPGVITCIALADRGEAVAVGATTGLRLFSIVGARNWKLDAIGSVSGIAPLAGGEWLAVAAARTVRVVRSADGTDRWAGPNTHPGNVVRIAASTDAKWIATGCTDRTTRIIDAATAATTLSVVADGKVQALAFHPTRPSVASGNEDGTITLIDADTAAQVQVQRLFGCTQLQFSADASMLAASWEDNTVSVYDVSTAGVVSPIVEFSCAGTISSLGFGAADQSIAVTDGTVAVRLFEPRSGKEQPPLLHPDAALKCAFGAGGTLIASTCRDNIVRLFATAPGG